MRHLIIYGFMFCFMLSCKKETTYQLRILIKNETKNNLTITLFPKSEFMYGDLYDFSAIGGGYSNTIIDISPDDEAELYISNNLQIKPNDLATQVFDSIHVRPYNEDKMEMKFSPDTVIGFSENLFDNESKWLFEKRNFEFKTNFKTNPIVSYDYSFTISEDKY